MTLRVMNVTYAKQREVEREIVFNVLQHVA